MKEISSEKLEKYISVTKRAIEKASKSGNRAGLVKEREDCLDMIKRYFSDALHFQSKGDFDWAEKNKHRSRKDCKLFLQPEWSKADILMDDIVEYVKAHPEWNISLQSHKYMRIP